MGNNTKSLSHGLQCTVQCMCCRGARREMVRQKKCIKPVVYLGVIHARENIAPGRGYGGSSSRLWEGGEG